MVMPGVHYVRVGDAMAAYQAFGSGDIDILFLPEVTGHLEVQWEEPAFARNLERLSSFARVIMVDRRGFGLADPVAIDQQLTQHWIADLEAACAAVGTSSVAVIACGAISALALRLAAERPDLVSHLVVLGGTARLRATPDYTIGLSAELLDPAVEYTRQNWGSGEMLSWAAPDRKGDPLLQAWFAKFERNIASPNVAADIQRWAIAIDERDTLAAVEAPALVIHRQEDPLIPCDHGRYVAAHIAHAEFRTLPGSAHLCFGSRPLEWIDEVREFITGSRRSGTRDRVLATVLFTDLVESTPRAARLGDERWRDLLHRYQNLVDRTVRLYGGTIVDCTGDGHLLRFPSASDAVECGLRLIGEAADMGFDVRAGAHIGEMETYADDLAGIVVHIGARIGALAGPGELWVSRTIVDVLEGSHQAFEPVGDHELRGVVGSWSLFRLVPD